MAVPVVNIRVMLVAVLKPFMVMHMRMGLAWRIVRLMFMLMVLIVDVPVFMMHWFVDVRVSMALGHVQP
jgi:hypothetical protein